MNLATNRNIFFLYTFAVILLVCAGSLNISFKRPSIKVSKQDSALNFNNDLLLLFSAGQKRLITDSLWIFTLLDSDFDHYVKKDLNSWMYLRFKSIVNLDPKFLSAYRFGGKYLSIIKDDLLGADEIFTQGLKYYPDDYDLLYDAGFLLAFELRDFKRAKPIYEKLVTYKQAPDFIPSLLNKIDFSLHSDLPLTYKVIQKMLETTPKKTNLHQRLTFDLYRIKAEIDLNCWNTNQVNCEPTDYFGNRYIIKQGKYTTQHKFKPYRLKIKN